MKKFFITVIALVCAAMISGCNGDADFVDVIVKKLPKREQKTESAENVIVNSQDKAKEKKPLDRSFIKEVRKAALYLVRDEKMLEYMKSVSEEISEIIELKSKLEGLF